MTNEIVSIEPRILTLRGQKVMLDRDLAELYGVPTYRLNEAVKRNSKRFPAHFMFQLSRQEKQELIANCDRFKTLKHSTVLPYAFTEHGVAMLSSVLNSERAIQINIQIIDAFIAAPLRTSYQAGGSHPPYCYFRKSPTAIHGQNRSPY